MDTMPSYLYLCLQFSPISDKLSVKLVCPVAQNVRGGSFTLGLSCYLLEKVDKVLLPL